MGREEAVHLVEHDECSTRRRTSRPRRARPRGRRGARTPSSTSGPSRRTLRLERLRHDLARRTHDSLPRRSGQAAKELAACFAKKRTTFDVPLGVGGTPFQRTVYKALLDVKFGETRSCADIAAAIGKGKAFRAVGGANNENPIGIIVPCHRIIGAGGSLTGYGGGLPVQEWLLAHERNKD
ncbi:MAG: methylated-DNA--[protein]-cysteine S-methyltransferase [Polyangiaceae bacterium]